MRDTLGHYGTMVMSVIGGFLGVGISVSAYFLLQPLMAEVLTKMM